MSLRTVCASNHVGPAIVVGVSGQGAAPSSRSTGDGGRDDGAAAVGVRDDGAAGAAGWEPAPSQAARRAPSVSRPPAARTARRSMAYLPGAHAGGTVEARRRERGPDHHETRPP